MENLPTDFLALLALVFVWGAKHGFDADHLATIDGLTRYNAPRNPALAAYCGSLFSFGHGTVVLLVAVVVSTLAAGWQVPVWLDQLGSGISISFLVLLAFVNVKAVWQTPAHQVVAPVAGPKGRLLARFQHTGRPALVAGVGALFALSFDTLSQATLFALTAGQFGGWQHGLALGLSFLLGMLLCDGLNGWWIARLLRRSDGMAAVVSRVMGLAIAGIALTVAGFGLARHVSPAVEAWLAGSELLFGLAVAATVLISFVVAARLAMPVAANTAAR
ncbi:MAG TPA: nickel transporter [Rhodocyclaceae bacterium]|nr:nickel transporter [Rhodocyclaceae bacterium]